jgi:hypothetical protein
MQAKRTTGYGNEAYASVAGYSVRGLCRFEERLDPEAARAPRFAKAVDPHVAIRSDSFEMERHVLGTESGGARDAADAERHGIDGRDDARAGVRPVRDRQDKGSAGGHAAIGATKGRHGSRREHPPCHARYSTNLADLHRPRPSPVSPCDAPNASPRRGGTPRFGATDSYRGAALTRLTGNRAAVGRGVRRRRKKADYFVGFGKLETASSPIFVPMDRPTTVEFR